ncbi:Bug family tripartite tricarboxylate transporter substrate binding protein [Variovorax sp. Root434]|uniref:Bug family tripartite tricarboxylate transporter substrate binding protein n=1 Tax=Variovorax sp. Root434 TaxID=1736536 RepID=UPI000714E787|nr:tripartite tricarboxylate transporter substrate binding protein [Variovorax sp. Root434]KQX31966.1 hypothetical protein ASD05_27945 [Variovorax sp. Root434]
MNSVKRRCLVSALLAACTLVVAPAYAEYPTKPIKIVVPFPPGGSPDLVARVLSQKLQEIWKQPILVENTAGAGGAIGAQYVARAPADGYTWLMAPNSVLVFAPLLQRQPYDPVKSFTPVGLAVSVQNLLVVNPSLPIKSVQELLDYSKANPGKLSYASGGMGSPQNLSAELLKKTAGVDLVHVPYRGAQAALLDVMSGLTPVFISQSNSLLPYVENGKLRLLGGTGLARYPSLPNVPALSETLPGFSVDIWTGVMMPANTPNDIVQQANAAITKVLSMPDVQAVLAKQGIEVHTSTPDQMASVIKTDLTRWGKIVKDANIKAE